MSTVETLCDAIRLMRIVTFTYKGAHRVVHPHVVCRDRFQEPSFAGWQAAGRSSSGRRLPDWIQCSVAEMTDLKVLTETFAGPRPDYNPDSYSDVVCRLPK
jgi:hypothetical protein